MGGDTRAMEGNARGQKRMKGGISWLDPARAAGFFVRVVTMDFDMANPFLFFLRE